MRLELTNFRCWKKRVFEFPDKGLALLSGSSGAGKSSILSAIYFVLYGTKTNILTHGEKKCSVRFVYEDLDITRTKGPNRLMLSVISDSKILEYEDDVAQGIITKKFGTNFTLTSYITQKSVQSFLNLGPTDKMNFLEQLALGDEDISGVKKKAKEKIKEKKDILQQKVGQLELLTVEIGEMKTPEEILFPLGNKHSDIKIKNEGVFWKRTIKELGEKKDLLKKVESEYSKDKVNKAIKNGKQTSLEEIEGKREKLEKEISEIEFDDNIDDLKSTLSFLKNKREFSSISDRYNEERTRYDDLYKQEMTVLRDEENVLKEKLELIDRGEFSDAVIKKIEEEVVLIEYISSLNAEISGYEKTRSQMKDYDREQKINELEEKIEVLQKEITTTERRFDIKCCPNCKVSLRFSKTNLILADGEEPVDEEKSKIEIKRIKGEILACKTLIDSVKKEITMISYNDKKIKECKDKLNLKKVSSEKTIEISKDEIKILREKKREYDGIVSSLKSVSLKIKEEDLSLTLKKLKQQVDKRKKELEDIKKQLEEELETDYTEEELREEISKQELLSQKKKALNKQLGELKTSIDKLKVEIEKITVSDRDFEEEIKEISENIKSLITKEEEHKQLDVKIKRYLQYKKEEEEYKRWTDKLSKCKEEEDIAKKELSFCDIFLRKIQEAESISIAAVIDNINYHMNYFLEKFFPDNPINVEIKSFKETKKDIKPSINISVGYKGIENSSLDSLSGGEYDRVLLSLTLALSNLFGSNLILLDESISSLDSELCDNILECLKENMIEKLVVIVAHQISCGMFDNIIDVSSEN